MTDGNRDFNPPAPCGAGLLTLHKLIEVGVISIRPPRARRDSNSAQNFFCAGLHNAQFNDCAGLAAHFLQPPQCNFSGYSSILRCEPTGVHL